MRWPCRCRAPDPRRWSSPRGQDRPRRDGRACRPLRSPTVRRRWPPRPLKLRRLAHHGQDRWCGIRAQEHGRIVGLSPDHETGAHTLRRGQFRLDRGEGSDRDLSAGAAPCGKVGQRGQRCRGGAEPGDQPRVGDGPTFSLRMSRSAASRSSSGKAGKGVGGDGVTPSIRSCFRAGQEPTNVGRVFDVDEDRQDGREAGGNVLPRTR